MLQCTSNVRQRCESPVRPRNCPALPRPIDWPRMFEARFQSFDDPQPAQTGPRVQALRAELAQARAVRPDPAARRPAPERIRAALRGAAGLADRLHRLGRDDRGARRQGRAVRRWPLHACRREPRSTHRCSRSCRSPTPRRSAGSSRTCRRAPSSATTPGCTPPRAPSGWRAPAPMPARRSSRSSPIRSTRSGPTGRRRRSAPVVLHDLRFAGEATERQARQDPRRDRKPARRRAGGLRSACRGLDLQHPRLRRRAHAAAARLRHRAEGRPADALHRRRKALQRGAPQARRGGRGARARRFHRRSQGARRRASHRAARPGDRRRRAVAHHRRGRRQGDARARSDRDDEGGQEPGRDRGRARRASCATARR